MFYKLRCALARFMYGRNGPDHLSRAIVWAVLIVYLVSMIVRGRFPMLGGILYWVGIAGWVWVVFRMFSKNLPKRREENQKWLNWWWAKKRAIANAKAHRADKEHKYFTCQRCNAVCRVPRGKGKIVITCPKCGAQIQGKS